MSPCGSRPTAAGRTSSFASLRRRTSEQVVGHANARCDQENLIEQLKNGVNALRVPVYDLVSNWAYMVIASLAWSLKAWMGLVQPRESDRDDLLRMEFKRFLNRVMRIPCQVVRTARRVLVRILGYTDRVRLLFETVAAAGRVSARRWSDVSRRAGRLGRSGVT